MNTFKTLALAGVALGAVAMATPAQARDRHHRHGGWDRHWDSHRHGRVVFYSAPRHYYRPYYRSYSYYRPYYYDDYAYSNYGYRPYYYGGPSISFAFGGSRSGGGWHHGGHHHHR
jgi:hypothetical protein